MLFPKPTRYVDEDYLSYIRTLPCLGLNCGADSGPHHFVTRGAGGSDHFAVPLCQRHHTEIHWGRETWQKKHACDLWRECARLLSDYLRRGDE